PDLAVTQLAAHDAAASADVVSERAVPERAGVGIAPRAGGVHHAVAFLTPSVAVRGGQLRRAGSTVPVTSPRVTGAPATPSAVAVIVTVSPSARKVRSDPSASRTG